MGRTATYRDLRSSTRRDSGTTFIELLISIVLIGIIVVGVMTALSLSIRGSDQHKSKVGALADLEGVAAYMNRVSVGDSAADCPAADGDPTPFQGYITAGQQPGRALENFGNPGVLVEATQVRCTSGVATVTLRATHLKGNATETLDVTVGGITVLEPGNLSASPGPGACAWTSFNIDEANPVRKPSGRLDRTVTVTLGFTGDCTTQNAALTVNPTEYASRVESMNLVGTATGGVFEFTFAKAYLNPWKLGNVDLSVLTSDGHSATSYFEVV